MKRMTCRDLGGACDHVFEANTFEELAEQSKQHGMAMFMAEDPAHLEAMEKIKALMQSPEQMQEWMDEKRKAFEALPDA